MTQSSRALRWPATFVLLLFFLGGCQIAAPPIQDHLRSDCEIEKKAESLQATVGELANGGGNIGRLAALKERIVAKGLSQYLTKQHIDWYSLQQNLIIEIPGHSEQIVYLVAHYDKTDATPLSFTSLMLNGVLDTLISPIYFSDGALDNATGVAVILELATKLSQQDNYYTYRFLFAGSEETGLRGSRVHVARLPAEDRAAIAFAINVDTVGVRDKNNCITNGVSDPQLSYQAAAAAQRLRIELNHDRYPISSTSDYLPFQQMSTASDFSYGLQLNFVGGLLPQRSWLPGTLSIPTVNFSSCGIVESSSDFITNFLLPFGNLHGFRDSTTLVDIESLYELYLVIGNMLRTIEKESTLNAPEDLTTGLRN